MEKRWLPAVLSGVLMIAAMVFVVVLLLVKLLWAWTVPDLFPGAVQQGLVAATISWLTAFKLALCCNNFCSSFSFCFRCACNCTK